MSSYLYDEALAKKLSKWYEGTELNIYTPSDTQRLFEVIADNSDDSPIKLPILAISRVGGFTITNTNKQPLTYEGLKITDGFPDKNAVLYAIPIKIDYQLDIYTRYYKEADAIARDLIFNIINHPTLNFNIIYNGVDMDLNCALRIGSEVSDNSDVPQRFIAGNFTRLTLNLNLDDAYLWNIKQKGNVTLADVDVETKLEIID